MKVNLSVEEYNLLNSKKFLNSNLMTRIKNAFLTKNNSYVLEISEEDADTIRDLCGEQLQKIGFDENYNPTSEGLILESLIDKFFVDKIE